MVSVCPNADKYFPMFTSKCMSTPSICHLTFRIHLAFSRKFNEILDEKKNLQNEIDLPKFLAAIVREQTSYVPSDTIHKLVASFDVGFQSSNVVSKSSANLKQSPKNLPVETNDPELQAANWNFPK